MKHEGPNFKEMSKPHTRPLHPFRVRSSFASRIHHHPVGFIFIQFTAIIYACHAWCIRYIRLSYHDEITEAVQHCLPDDEKPRTQSDKGIKPLTRDIAADD